MAYADFTAKDLEQKFNIEFQGGNLFADVQAVEPTDWLITSLEIAQGMGISTEKSRSERLVTPVLFELSHRNHHSFSIYSGANMDVSEEQGLRGECDFIFSFSQFQDIVKSPVFCITEAKKLDLEKGIVQATAQLIGAKMMNEMENNPIDILYGCSTTGREWRFLKYHDNQVIVDKKYYHIGQLPELLGILQYIVEESKKQFPELAVTV